MDELAAIAKETTELEELHAKIRMTSEIVPSPRAEPTEPPPPAAVHLVDVERADRADTTTTSSASATRTPMMTAMTPPHRKKKATQGAVIFDRHRVIFARGDVMVKPKNNPRIAAVVNSAARQVMVVNGRRVVVERVRSAVMLENQRRSRVCRVCRVSSRASD